MSKALQNSIQILLFALFAFPLFKINIVNLFFILLLVLAILSDYKKIIQFISFENLKLTIPFWIILITSILYSNTENWHDGINNAVPFLMYPLTFFLLPNSFFDNTKLDKYLLITKISCLFIIISYLGLFINEYSIDGFFKIDYGITKFRDFIYNEVSIFRIHPTYFTILLVFLIGNSLNKLIHQKSFFDFFFIIFSIVMIFLSLSKISIILVILLVIYFTLSKLTISLSKKIILLVLSAISFAILISNIPGVINRFSELILSFNSNPDGVAHDSTNIRVALYKCDFSLLKDNFISGIGFHEIKEEIHLCLASNYDATFYENHLFLTHNYFIYILLGSGVLGFSFFFYYVINLIKTAISLKSFGLNLLLFCVFISCLSEDFLYRNFGSIFFLVFFFLYFKNYKYLTETKVVPNNID